MQSMYELYYELYVLSVETKEKMFNRLPLLITLIGLLFTLWSFIYKNLNIGITTTYSFAIYFLSGVYLLFFLWSIIGTILSFFRYRYAYIDMDALIQFEKSLITYYDTDEGKVELKEGDVNEFVFEIVKSEQLKEMLQEASRINNRSNERKSRNINGVALSMIICILIGIVLCTLYFNNFK